MTDCIAIIDYDIGEDAFKAYCGDRVATIPWSKELDDLLTSTPEPDKELAKLVMGQK